MKVGIVGPDDVKEDGSMHDDGDGQEEGPVRVGDGFEPLAPVAGLRGIDGAGVDPVHDGRGVCLQEEVTQENFDHMDHNSVDGQSYQEHIGGQLEMKWMF